MTAEQFTTNTPTTSSAMTAHQQMRAAAIQGAAAFCASTPRNGSPPISALDDVLFVADVFAAYIENGWQGAREIYATSAKHGKPTQPETVELREAAPVAPPAEASESAVPSVEPPPNTEPVAAPAEPAAPEGNVIPLAARGEVSEKQTAAWRIIERNRRARAQQLANEAVVAKTEEHKQRIIDAMNDGELDGVMVKIDGELQQLGAYLRNLYRS